MQELPWYSLREAAQYLADRLDKPCLVEHIESLIKFGEILACVNPGWRILYLPPLSYGMIKKGLCVAAAESLEQLREHDWRTFSAGELHIDDVVIQREVLDSYVNSQKNRSLHKIVDKCSSLKWTLRKPRRDQGYNMALYGFLKAAHDAGDQCPTAAQVFQEWKVNPPPGYSIKVADNLRSMTYAGGGKQPERKADAEAVTKCIRKFTEIKIVS